MCLRASPQRPVDRMGWNFAGSMPRAISVAAPKIIRIGQKKFDFFRVDGFFGSKTGQNRENFKFSQNVRKGVGWLGKWFRWLENGFKAPILLNLTLSKHVELNVSKHVQLSPNNRHCFSHLQLSRMRDAHARRLATSVKSRSLFDLDQWTEWEGGFCRPEGGFSASYIN